MADVYASGNHAGNTSKGCQILPTLLLPIRTKCGVKKLRALLDTGSTSTFIATESLLGVPNEVIESGISLMIRSIQGSRKENSRKVRIHLSDPGEGEISLECFVVPYITEIYRDNDVNHIKHPAIRNLSLNEPLSHRQGKIDILLGTPDFWRIVKGVSKRINAGLVVLDTVLGMFYAVPPRR